MTVAEDIGVLDWVGLAWFVACWIGYTRYSGFRCQRRRRIQDALHAHIKRWIQVMHQRDVRMVDTSVVANLERNATFFASSSLLIIAALTTAIGSSDAVARFMSDLPLIQRTTTAVWELAVLLLIGIYAYAFFTFTWCMRQWGFASILVGSAPLADASGGQTPEIERHSDALAQVIWLSVYHFNLGLRAYYFSLALLTWIVHPILFMVASAWIVAVLYRREFRSRTLDALLAGLE